MNGAGNGKFDSPFTSVLPSKRIVAVAVAVRSCSFEPGPLTVVTTGPVPVQLALTETVCVKPRLSRTLANVPLRLTLLRFGSNCVGAAWKKPQLKVPSGHWPENPIRRGGLGAGVVPASMKLSVSTIMRPPWAVEPSGHWNGIKHRAEALCSVKPFAAHAITGRTSKARAESRGIKYLYGRGDRVARRRRGDCGAGMRELLVRVGVVADVHRSEDPGLCDRARP